MPNVVLTGANRGIGLGLARRFASRPGYRLIAAARDPGSATELAALVAETGGATIHPLDLCDEASIAAFASRVMDEVEQIDILLHNAAAGGNEPLDELTLDLFSSVFCANVFGVAVLTRQLRPALRSGSLVVAVSSNQGSIARADGQNGFPYRMSKAALNMFVQQLSIQLKPEGIGVLALRPGYVRTRLSKFDPAGLEVEEAAERMVGIIDGFSLDMTGSFLGIDGTVTPW